MVSSESSPIRRNRRRMLRIGAHHDQVTSGRAQVFRAVDQHGDRPGVDQGGLGEVHHHRRRVEAGDHAQELAGRAGVGVALDRYHGSDFFDFLTDQ